MNVNFQYYSDGDGTVDSIIRNKSESLPLNSHYVSDSDVSNHVSALLASRKRDLSLMIMT